MLVDTGGAPSIRVTTGSARVTVRDGASGVVVGVTTQNVNPAGSAVSWLSGRATVTPTAWWGPSMWVTVGEATSSTAGSATVPGLGIEFLPPVGPRPPVLTAPGAGEEINASAPNDFSWMHQSSRAGGKQGGWSWRISSSSGWLYWSQAAGALTSSETQNAGAAGTFPLPGGSLDNLGVGRVWQVRTQESIDGLWSPWSVERAVTPVTPPILSLTVASPHGDLSPTITGTPTISRPASVVVASHWQIRDTSGAIIWDSGVLAGQGVVHDVPASTPWVNGASVTAWGRVQQTGGAWSAWSSSAPFVVSWTPPPTPAVSAGTRYTSWVEEARNFAVNPSFGTAGAPVGVVTNLWSDPLPNGVGLANGQARWSQNTAGVPVSIDSGWARAQADTSGISDAIIFRASNWAVNGLPIATNTLYRLSFELERASGLPDAVASRWEYDAGGGIVVNDATMTLQTDPGSGRRFVEFTSHASAATVAFVLRRAATPWQAGDWYRIRRTMLAVPILSPGTFVGGGVSTDPDLTGVWAGTAHQSSTLVQGVSVPGVISGGNAVAVRSTRWAKNGTHSVRIIPNNPSDGDSYIEASVPAVGTLRSAARAVGALHLEGAQGAPGQHARARRILAGWPEVRGTQAANTAGDTDHDFTWSGAGGHNIVRFYNGAARGQGEVWWDALGIFDPAYTGGWFDGSNLPAGLDPALWRVRWLGTPHNSMSVLESREVAPPVSNVGTDVMIDNLTPGNAVVVWSSTDDGLTWNLVESFTATTGSALLTDPLVASGKPMRWSAIQYQIIDGMRLPSERGVSDAYVPTTYSGIVTSAYSPATRWIEAVIRNADPNVWPRLTAAHHLLNNKYALVLRGQEKARQGRFILVARDDAEREALHELLQGTDPLILQMPPEFTWSYTALKPGERVTVRVVSEHSEPRIKQEAWEPREIPVEWVEARTPAVGEAPPGTPITHPIIHL
ncbi:hypothetical protein [Microbacterium sp. No. 7]|uniref:hypothetical protein n=1 Tax=Microbacterium sp. No. 7 TaxID=1714373 RepID=UPI0012E180CC|nr:hypothetical protein [Microbacterium sp. No. 7]